MDHLRIRRPAAVAAAVLFAAALSLGGWTFGETMPVDSASTPTTVTGSPGASQDNAAVATNTQDGKTVIALAIKIVQTDNATVDAANGAVAAASCTDCTTVAIALEGVLVVGSPTDFDPTNIALAINSECSNCQTLAAAYQKVVQNDTRVRISGAGRREIADIRTDLLSLRNSGLDITTIQQRVEDAAARFIAVLENEVYPIGPPASSSTTLAAATAGASTTTTVVVTTTAAPTSSTTAPATTTTTTTAVP